MVNSGVDGYAKTPNQQKISDKRKRRQSTKNQNNTKSEI